MKPQWDIHGAFLAARNIRMEGGRGAETEPRAGVVALFGAPLDMTTTFRPGTRLGPSHIREASQVLEEYSPRTGAVVSGDRFLDLGDLVLPFGTVKMNLDIIREGVLAVLERGAVPFMLGGEHLVTLPAVEAVTRRYEGLAIVHLDAHADMRDEYLGESLSHATVMRRVAELVGFDNVFQLGVRSGTIEEMNRQGNLYPERVIEHVPRIAEMIGDRPVYLTIDIDVLDPAFAPGTGTPEPGGVTSRELLTAVVELARLNIVGLDLVEVSPPHDHSEITSIVAAKAVREAVAAITARFEG